MPSRFDFASSDHRARSKRSFPRSISLTRSTPAWPSKIWAARSRIACCSSSRKKSISLLLAGGVESGQREFVVPRDELDLDGHAHGDVGGLDADDVRDEPG